MSDSDTPKYSPTEDVPSVEQQKINALNKLADYLARRDHSTLELTSKLRQKGYSQEIINWAVNEAEERRWLSDPYELSERVSATLHRKDRGILYINRYLQEKGLPPVEKDFDLERQKALRVIERKLNKVGNLSYAEKQKAYKYLSYRGFDDETTKKVIYEKS